MSAAVALMRHVGRENPTTQAGFVLFTIVVIAAVFGSALAPYDPLSVDAALSLKPPTAAHWFGTDQQGRDIFSRVLVATRLDLTISIAAVALSFAIGTPVGAAAGYFGGWTERIVSRVVDVLMAFPLFVLAMGIVAVLGNTLANIIYATAIVNVPFYARMARAEVNVRMGAGYVEAARMSGNGGSRLLFAVLVPNVLPPMMVQVSLNMGWAILNAAGLSFIGLGVRPPTPEWGIMVSEGASFMISGEWWVAFFPGMALILAVISFNLMGDGLRDMLDPRRRS